MKKNQNKPNCNNICSVRRPAYTTGAFTLVELIVVITILAILGTIAFISLQGYSSQARDSKRLSDISNIKKSVELFSLNTGKYPKPDDSFTVSYSGETLRYQGTVGDQVSTNLSRNLNEKPVDPSTGLEYTYSTTHSQTEYEVLGLYESDLISTSPLFFAKATKSRQPSPLRGEGARPNLFSSSNAAISDYPKIDGNYNGIYIKTSSYYVPTPTIINAEIVSDDDLDSDNIKSQIITGGDNIFGVSTGGLDITLSVYTGSIIEDSTDAEKMELVQVIQTAYDGSQLASDTMYADIISRTSTGDMVDFVDIVVLNKAEYTSSSSGGDTVSDWDVTTACSGANSGDIIYESTNSDDDTGLTCEHDIAVCNGSGTGYVISACNLGATTASTDWTVSRGNYFQWGRNKAFAYDDDTQQATQISNIDYNSNNDEYGFVWNSNLSSYRYDWILNQDNNLWGDNSGTGTNEQRQGPCPTGYHVPSKTEWVGIITVGQWGTNGDNMKNDLLLPYVGYRSWNNTLFYYEGSRGYYWTSSPNGSGGYRLHFRTDYINPNENGYRASGFFIRCFKN